MVITVTERETRLFRLSETLALIPYSAQNRFMVQSLSSQDFSWLKMLCGYYVWEVGISRRFVLIEQDAKYMSVIRERVKDWLGMDAQGVFTIEICC